MPSEPRNFVYRLWDEGQAHLGAGRYVTARRELERAESIAWRNQDARSLARLYLPLLEARRLIRYQAAEGTIFIGQPGVAMRGQLLSKILNGDAGTVLLTCATGGAGLMEGCRWAGFVQHTTRRTGRCWEALLLIQRRAEIRVASAADPHFTAGLPVQWATDSTAVINSSTDPELCVPLPPPDRYPATGDKIGLHAMATESLIVAWEALALRWQHRHPPPSQKSGVWEEMAWLRLALRVDPACEPVTMRLIALAEAVQRADNE